MINPPPISQLGAIYALRFFVNSASANILCGCGSMQEYPPTTPYLVQYPLKYTDTQLYCHRWAMSSKILFSLGLNLIWVQ